MLILIFSWKLLKNLLLMILFWIYNVSFLGTFAISSLLAGTEVEEIFRMESINHKIAVDHMNSMNNSNMTTQNPMTTIGPPPIVHDKIHIAMIITFVVGILQVRYLFELLKRNVFFVLLFSLFNYTKVSEKSFIFSK